MHGSQATSSPRDVPVGRLAKNIANGTVVEPDANGKKVPTRLTPLATDLLAKKKHPGQKPKMNPASERRALYDSNSRTDRAVPVLRVREAYT